MAYEQYNQMASNFGSSFQPEEGELTEEEIELTTRSLTEIRDSDIAAVKNTEETIRDQEYILRELKVDIELLGDVTETLRCELKQGAKTNQFDSFVNLMKERREHLKTYKDTNVEIIQLENDIKETPTSGTPVINNTLVLQGNDAFDMILAARDGINEDKDIKLDESKEV